MNAALLQRAGDTVGRALGVLASAALFSMMVLTFVDVIGRKFFVAVPGALELSEMLMVVVLFSGLPLVAWHAEHVCFELVDSMYKGRAAEWSRRFMDGVCAVTFGALAVATWKLAGRTMSEGEVSSRLHWPIGIFIYLMAALLAAAFFMHMLRTFGAKPFRHAHNENAQ